MLRERSHNSTSNKRCQGVLTKAELRSQIGVTGSNVSGNTAQGSGGGIFNDLEGQLALTGVTVSNNTARRAAASAARAERAWPTAGRAAESTASATAIP
jgi:hypothetical protein